MIKDYEQYNEGLKGVNRDSAMKSLEGKSIVDVIEMLISNNYKTLREIPMFKAFLNDELDIDMQTKSLALNYFPSEIGELGQMGDTETYNLMINDLLNSEMLKTIDTKSRNANLLWIIIFVTSINSDINDSKQIIDHIKQDTSSLNEKSLDNLILGILCNANDIVRKHVNEMSQLISVNSYDMDWDLYDYCVMSKNIEAFEIVAESLYDTTYIEDVQYNDNILTKPEYIKIILKHPYKYSSDKNKALEFIRKNKSQNNE